MSGPYFDVDAFDPEAYDAHLEERAELERTRVEALPGYDRWKLISDMDARADLMPPEEPSDTGCPQERWCTAVYDKLVADGLTEGEAIDETLRRWRKARANR